MEGLKSLKKCCHCKNEQPLTCYYKKIFKRWIASCV